MEVNPVATPNAPSVLSDDGTGPRSYSLVAIGPQGQRSNASPPVVSHGYATLSWSSTPGADAYLVLRDDHIVTSPLRIEGSTKQWSDAAADRERNFKK